jgi:type IV pilus assembly protein PilX
MKSKQIMSSMARRSTQRGIISTLIAIIVLVVTLMAAIALMRSVDTSNTIAGSLTFRQGVLQEGERAYVDATSKITWTEPATDANNTALGYYASPLTADTTRPDLPAILTPSTASTATGVVTLPEDSTNNTVSYVVERMCSAAGAVSAANCIVPGAPALGGQTGGNGSDTTPPPTTPAYRLTVRIQGPKGTLAFVQTMLH